MNRRETGTIGENLAKEFLSKNGYNILETNYRCPLGEIDIVADCKDTLVFVEVRTRSSRKYGLPEESVTPVKVAHLMNLCEHYRQNHDNLPESWRIDFVAVEMNRNRQLSRIELIENAIGGSL
jgi:putative endonuclease